VPEWLIVPEVAAKFTVYEPTATEEATLTVTVWGVEAVTEKDVPGSTVTPVGKLEIATLTEPAKPLRGTMLTLNVVEAPEFRVTV
jgi:hypothetical protein